MVSSVCYRDYQAQPLDAAQARLLADILSPANDVQDPNAIIDRITAGTNHAAPLPTNIDAGGRRVGAVFEASHTIMLQNPDLERDIQRFASLPLTTNDCSDSYNYKTGRAAAFYKRFMLVHHADIPISKRW